MYKATVEFYGDDGKVVGTFVAYAGEDYTYIRNLVTRINTKIALRQIEDIATAMGAQDYRAVLVA